MPSRNNPFEPNKPVNPYMFTGRHKEIEKVHRALCSTLDGNPNHLLFIGERGIGKSSILLLAKNMSDGTIQLYEDKYKFITTYIALDNNTSKIDLCRKIQNTVEQVYRDNKDKKQMIKDIWRFAQRIEISGSKIGKSKMLTDAEIVDNLITSISKTVQAIMNTDGGITNGLVFLIDEIDNSSESLELGLMIKKITEQLAFDGANSALFILSGLPCSRDILEKSHPSSLRIFEECTLKPLTEDDCKSILQKGLKKASEKNKNTITVDDEAIETIAFRSEGYPHFIQQFAYCSYEIDTDNVIDSDDVTKATRKALELIGNRYYRNLYYKKINKDSYRQVLQIMAVKLDEWVSKREIKEEFKGKDTTLNNAINKLIKENIILRKQGSRGKYKLQWIGFALWIRFIAEIDQ